MVELEGMVDDIIYKNEQNGYTVLELKCDKDSYVCVGNMPQIAEGSEIKVQGEFKVHPDYGEQLYIESYTTTIPKTQIGIVKYLSSGIIKGIGKSLAERIVKKYKEKTLEILYERPEELLKVEGIGKSRLEIITKSFAEQAGIMKIYEFMSGYDISPRFAVKIYNQYGSDSIDIIKTNPYRLCFDIQGLGFAKVDSLGLKMGISEDDPNRVAACIRYVLIQSSLDGNTYLPEDKLYHLILKYVQADDEVFSTSLTMLFKQGYINMETMGKENVVYYAPYYQAEVGVSKKLFELALTEVETLPVDFEKDLLRIAEETGISLSGKQKEAVVEAFRNGVLIITGGPGTGKTTTINYIIKIFEGFGKKVALAAPTGRAAKRMTEATQREAKTIHRLLEYNVKSSEDDIQSGTFQKDEAHPLKYDTIIVDETSMVDLLLMNNFLKAVRPGTRLIFVGDADQLPSVGAGDVLRDMISSGIIRVIKLDEIFRQAQKSLIVTNAHKINNGEYPACNEKDNDFFFIQRVNQEDMMNEITSLVADRLPRAYGFDPLKDIQVLCPMKKGGVGVYRLNERLQSLLNSNVGKRPNQDMIFRCGDKVMQIKNNYDTEWEKDSGESGTGVYNGDIGYIKDVDYDEQTLMVEFDDLKKVTYPFYALDELMLAYAITIHKSQGSEFPAVVMPVTWGPDILMTRNLLYTAVTRAKKMVVLVGNEKYLMNMIDNDKILNRFSGLSYRLKKAVSAVSDL